MSPEIRHRQVTLGECSVHVAEAGASDGHPYVFLHGWPQCWAAWRQVMLLAGADARAIAIDLPGIGGSTGPSLGGNKRRIAVMLHGLISSLGLDAPTIVGHDLGGMVAYAYLRRYDNARRVVIVNTAIPGVDPWDELLAMPHIWHFGFHAVPELPETMITGREQAYFDYFYRALGGDESKITPAMRTEHAEAYRRPGALTAGLCLYRALSDDAKDNAHADHGAAPATPMLYIGGDAKGQPHSIDRYVHGFRKAGIERLTAVVVPNTGHFVAEQAPDALWRAIRGVEA
jgi:pimeloyl-ACP methyl ester carboxylesterase